MKKNASTTRRDFLKMTAAGAAGLSIGAIGIKETEAKGLAWTATTQINPDIPNTRVVSCTDERMITDIAKARTASSFSGTTGQNSYIDTIRVAADMDAMAQSLTGKLSAVEAWAVIFRKPQGKEWSSVKAAIKVNCIYTTIMPKIPIVNKVCVELMRLGVLPANITIYDACSGASGSGKYTPFVGKGLPGGVIVSSTTGSDVSVPVGAKSLQCCAVLAQLSGSTIVYPTDILVNCAVNKGHGSGHGGFTMCMKNHTGTLKYSCPSAEEIITENQCEAIIGGSDNAPCRQQLCIVDSLWAAVDGPGSAPTHMPCAISMGTVAPVVDYQVALKIRKDVMNASPNQTVIDNWLTRFNINSASLEWIVVPPPISGADEHARYARPADNAGRRVSVFLKNSSFKTASVSFNLPDGRLPSAISIKDMKGNTVRRLHWRDGFTVCWNGRDQGGRTVAGGAYIITVHAGRMTKSAPLTAVR